MTESLLQIRDRLMPRTPRRYATEAALLAAPAERVQSLPAFVVENQETGKVMLTVPLELAPEVASGPSAGIVADDFLLKLSGRLVEAEKANGNGAFWSQEDLQFGMPSIAYGPLNWLHDERRVVGVLTSASMVEREAAAEVNLGPHVRADATLWKWLAPREAAMVADYADQRQAYYSMECISRQIACVGPGSCGAVMDYLDALKKTEKACEHVKERTASRRFVSPIFQGAAIIVPPVKPGWANADLAVQRQAAAATEQASLEIPGLDTKGVEAMVAQILAYSNTP